MQQRHLEHLQANQHEAACYLERSAERWRKLDMPLELARTLDRLGALHANAGAPASAESAWQEALKLLQRIGNPEAEQVASRLERLLQRAANAGRGS